jgi:hypothetical protein
MIMSRVSLIALRYVCCAMLLSASVQSFAAENDTNVPVGTRMMSKAEHVAIQEQRVKEAQEAGENIDVAPQADSVKSILESKESRMSAVNGISLDSPKASTYATTHTGAFHNPLSVSVFGDSITLEDGSIWAVSSSDSYKTLNWLTTDLLVITPNHEWFSMYEYCITNQNTGMTVRVTMVLGPLYDALFRNWIVAIDYVLDRVWLNDGSVWDMAIGDYTVLQKWLPGDTVIIGVNDGWFASYNPNILINVNVANYARGTCIVQ